MSSDGRHFTGWGLHNGIAEAFVVTLPCPSDFNYDGVVDFFDYLDFIAVLDRKEPKAGFNRDEVVDFSDYLDFAAAFEAGC